ncbi:MAG: anaerobic ribonucleoside-triphosphate reductase [Candidatus Bathyarchaeota archaeon]
MSKKKVRASAEIFDAVSAPTRIQTLKLIAAKGPLTYSEIMEMLNFEPTRDAGKFVYHLKNLIKAGLITFEKPIKKYKITDLGLMVIRFSKDLEEYALKKSGKMLVRTSRYTIEEFDRNKIVSVLVEEAGLSQDVAEKVSLEVEERLFKLPVKYLTAPLIREFVNAILLESDLEEYRHRLTRLGMPPYDVKRTIEDTSKKLLGADFVRLKAGDRVITEYMLLNSLPRNVADAHLSGQIHISNSNSWILTPFTVYHDLRIFLSGKFRALDFLNPYKQFLLTQPKTLTEAVSVTTEMLRFFEYEVSGEQGIDYFNVFLSPYAAKKSVEDIKKILKVLLLELSNTGLKSFSGVSLGLEVAIPRHLKNLPAIGFEGSTQPTYGDYEDEAQKILDLLLDVFLEICEKKPLFNPHLILKIRPNCLGSKYDDVLEKAHKIAANYGLLHIANLVREQDEFSSYLADGEKVNADWKTDWEIDTLRVCCLNSISINLPRIAYEARRDDDEFFDGIEKVIQLTGEVLSVKMREITKRFRENALPNFSSMVDGETYGRLDNFFGSINIVGLAEAVKFHLGYDIYEDLMPQNFALELMEHLVSKVNTTSKKLNLRIYVSQIPDAEASQKMAEQDTKLYGFSDVNVQGDSESPYYTFDSIIPDNVKISLDDRLRLEEKFYPIFNGGRFIKIPLVGECSSEELLKKTKEVCGGYNIGFYVYDSVISYCGYCKKAFKEFKQKCPVCGLTGIITYARESTVHLPLEWWSHKGRKNAIKKLE